jgi:hypothetical protein
MTNMLPVGIGAGLVSALLIAVVVKATALAVLLFLLAPIPILIVTLGWSHRAGLVASAVGGLALALALSPIEGFAFAVGTALPAWWLGYLALLGRPNPDGSTEWYPLGRLLTWIAATAAMTVLATALVSAGDYETFIAAGASSPRCFCAVRPGPRPMRRCPMSGRCRRMSWSTSSPRSPRCSQPRVLH